MSKQMEYVREHLALVFHRYLAGEPGITKLTIQMNGLKIEPKDPFLIGRSTVFQADEKFMIEGYPVEVSSFMLPYVSNLTKKEKAALGGTEGLTKDQGFYIFRELKRTGTSSMKRYMPPILFFNQMAKSMSSWIHMDVPEERTLKNSVNRFNWIRKQQVF